MLRSRNRVDFQHSAQLRKAGQLQASRKLPVGLKNQGVMQGQFADGEGEQGKPEAEHPEKGEGLQEADHASEEGIDPAQRCQVNHFPDHPADAEDDQCGSDKNDYKRERGRQLLRNRCQIFRSPAGVEIGRKETGQECQETEELADETAPDSDNDGDNADYDEKNIQDMHGGIGWRRRPAIASVQ